MDLLIDLIILLIKQATKSREPRTAPPTPAEAQRQREAMAQQIAAMQKTLEAQQARTRPSVQRGGARVGPVSWAQPQIRAAVPPVAQPPVPVIRPDATAPVRPAAPSTRIPGLVLPFLLGEALASPVALRDSEP